MYFKVDLTKVVKIEKFGILSSIFENLKIGRDLKLFVCLGVPMDLTLRRSPKLTGLKWAPTERKPCWALRAPRTYLIPQKPAPGRVKGKSW